MKIKQFVCGIISKFFDIKFLKFIIVGLLNTAIGMTINWAAYKFAHMGFWGSTAANVILTSIFSYFMNKRFTFKNKSRSIKVPIKFALTIAAAYFLGYGIAKPLTRRILTSLNGELADMAAIGVGMVLFVGFNYIGQRMFAFGEE